MSKIVGEYLNVPDLPKYLNVSSFESNYKEYLEHWKKQYRNGTELDYLKEVRKTYAQYVPYDEFTGEEELDKVYITIKVKRKVLDEEIEELEKHRDYQELDNLYYSMDKNGYIDQEIDLYTLYQLLDNRFSEQFKSIEYNQQDFEELSLKELCKKYQVLDDPKSELRFYEKDAFYSRDYRGVTYLTKQSYILYPYIVSDIVEYFFILGSEGGGKDEEIVYNIEFDDRKYKDFKLLVKNMLNMIDDKIAVIRGEKFQSTIKVEPNIDYKETPSEEERTEETEETEENTIIPIKLNLNKSQIAYLFKQLVDSGYLKIHQNPNVWKLVGQYFVDMNNKSMKDISQVMTNVTSRNKEGKPQYEADNIEEIVGNLKKFKD